MPDTIGQSNKFDKQGYARNMQPVILLLDTSGSMFGEKIDALNVCVRKMLDAFKNYNGSTDIRVAIITFGGCGACLETSFKSAKTLAFGYLSAGGGNYEGEALKIAGQLLSQLPSEVKRTIIVLVSDGMPESSYDGGLKEFLRLPNASESRRFAMGVGVNGGSAEYRELQKFISEGESVCLGDVDQMIKFFDSVTKNVTGLVMTELKTNYIKLY